MQVLGPMTGGNPLSDLVWPHTEADQAVADNFGFGSQGLQSSDITKYNSGGICIADWCGKFNQYTGQVPLELQTYGRSDPTGVCGTGTNPPCPYGISQQQTGPLPPLLTFGVQRHATIFELYTDDLLLAFDPNYPQYATYGATYAAAIAAARQ